MARIFDEIKDLANVFSSAFEHAEYDCYKLKDDIVKLLGIANSKGYVNPIKSELTIKVINKDQTIVVIELYFDGRVERYKKFSSTLDLGTLVNVPISLKQRLDRDRQAKIELDTDDFGSLFVISTKDIRPEDDYQKLVKVNIRDEFSIPQKKLLRIKDRIFFYEVEGIYVFDNGKKKSRKLYMGNINHMPSDIISKILNDPDLETIIDVTQI